MKDPVGRAVSYVVLAHLVLAAGFSFNHTGGATAVKRTGDGGGAVRAGAAAGGENRLYRLFNVRQVGAHVVIAVDTSLSMKGSFSVVRQALDAFSRTLRPQDLLTVIVFDNNSKRVYRGPAGAGSPIKAALPEKPNPDGHRTDMGEGVATVLKELDNTGDSLPVVVFLTDGREDPPKESRFAARHDQSWSELKNTAQSSPAAKRAFVHAIGLNNKTDINRLRQVWPGIQPLTINPSELTVYFAKLKERIRRERLRRELAKELGAGRIVVRVDDANWGAVRSGTKFKRAVTITSTFKRLPVDLTVAGASWRGFRSVTQGRSLVGHLPELAAARRRLRIGPGQTRRYIVDVRVPALKGRWGLKTEEKYRALMRLAVTGRPLDSQAISDLKVEPRIGFDGRDQTVWFYRSVGQSAYLLSALALALLGATAVFWRRGILPIGRTLYRRVAAPPLFGRLAFSGAPAGEQLPRPLSLEQFGRRTTIGASGKVRLKGKDIKEEHAEIFTEWAQGEPRVMIRQREGVVRVARAPGAAPVLAAEPTALKPGSVIQIGDYRIQWI